MEKGSDKGQILIEMLAFMILFTFFMIAISEQLRWADSQRQKTIQNIYPQKKGNLNDNH